MGYCTQGDVEDRIGQADLIALSDHGDTGSVDSGVVGRAIDSASAIIDGYLGVRFSVPISPVSEVLRTRAVNLAVYFLKLGRDGVTDEARAQYEDDVEWLRRVVAGRASVGADPNPAEPSGAPGADYESEPRLFGRGEPL